jgi:hypothetical protein
LPNCSGQNRVFQLQQTEQLFPVDSQQVMLSVLLETEQLFSTAGRWIWHGWFK